MTRRETSIDIVRDFDGILSDLQHKIALQTDNTEYDF